jgi:serine phosphatase RsbU (regulator of sigma subunit)
MRTSTKVYLGLLLAYVLCLPFSFLSSLRGFLFVAIVLFTAYYAALLARKLLRKLLWRIRRKLIVSYIFIGLVPLLLLAFLVLIGSFVFLGQTTSETFHAALDTSVMRVRMEAERLLNLSGSHDPKETAAEWLKSLSEEDRSWLRNAEIWSVNEKGEVALQGENNPALPQWLKKTDWSGMVIRGTVLYITAVGYDSSEQSGVVVLVPINNDLLQVFNDRLKADIKYFALGDRSAENEYKQVYGPARRQPVWPRWWDFPVAWLSFPDQFEWQTGKKLNLFDDNKDRNIRISTGYHPPKDGQTQPSVFEVETTGGHDINVRKTESSAGAFLVTSNVSRVTSHIFSRSSTLQKIAYGVMLGIALSFLFIEIVSLAFGFLLARSITSSVHTLFEGTERVRNGDLNYRIQVKTRDQLGDLAVSFNQMTDSIKELVSVRAEKERLAESLQIARQMQEKLLPGAIASLAGVDMATLNVAAQEMCGDYYDVIRKSDHEMGIIIADVSGKGPSAALYMAEVKGVILSLSSRTLDPKEVLVEANRILSPTLDSRNFITMTFAMVDDNARVMKICRAGHNPMLHYCAESGKIEILQPPGIGLGLSKNGIFEKTLVEIERNLCTGDVIVFYTDGLTEAMNEKRDFYGLDRLSEIIVKNASFSSDQIKSAILHDLHGFLKDGLPQDDVTLVLLKVR